MKLIKRRDVFIPSLELPNVAIADMLHKLLYLDHHWFVLIQDCRLWGLSLIINQSTDITGHLFTKSHHFLHLGCFIWHMKNNTRVKKNKIKNMIIIIKE